MAVCPMMFTPSPTVLQLVRPKFENNGTLSFITPELKLPFPDGTPPLDAADAAVAAGAGGGAGAGASVDGQSVAAGAGGAGPDADAEAKLDAGGTGGDVTERSTGDGKQADADDAAAATADEAADASADAAGDDGAAAAEAEGAAAASVSGEAKGAENDATDAGGASVAPSVAPSVDEVLPSARSAVKPQPSARATKPNKKQAEVVHPTFGSGKVLIDVAVRDGDFFETPASLLVYGELPWVPCFQAMFPVPDLVCVACQLEICRRHPPILAPWQVALPSHCAHHLSRKGGCSRRHACW